MSTRASRRSRSKTAKALASQKQESLIKSSSSPSSSFISTPTSSTNRKSKGRRSVFKPKYVLETESKLTLTPSSSRSGSPAVKSGGKKNSKKNMDKIPKLKMKIGRGYNPSLVNYKDSEYHYGSDFEEEEYEYEVHGDSEHSESLSDDSDFGGESDDLKVESDVEYESGSTLYSSNLSSENYLPPWLKDEAFPPLILPPSSEDLLISSSHILNLLSIYENCRQYRTLLRLSPFRFEDFIAAIVSDEQSNLLSEIHISLLRSIIRADEKDGTQFGALDQKDSLNCIFFFMDSITWPECLRSYVNSDPESFSIASDLLKNNAEYPLNESFVETRISILIFLCNQFLVTNSLRDYISSEGSLLMEDHCRVCHRLGDMLVCDSCGGVYHLSCLDPPLTDVPEEDWTCYVCTAHVTIGVTDLENEVKCLRHEALGFDRHGNKYWFLVRRLFIEHQLSGDVTYYSTVKQLEEVLSLLDAEDLEKDLWTSLESRREEMEFHMKVTEKLTEEFKKTSISYLEKENERILKRQELQDKERKHQNESLAQKIQDELAQSLVSSESSEIKNKGTEEEVVTTFHHSTEGLLPSLSLLDETKDSSSFSNESLFKLGSEGTFRTYINQYTSNPNALSKLQANEERDKRRFMSHKFSLTDVSVFKWQGTLFGNKDLILSTLRQTLITLENNILTMFMHPNWGLLRKPWIGAVTSCSTPRDFSRALIVLQCCMRPVILLGVWSEQLGHTSLKRITASMRDERKKIEKREKREMEEREDKLKPFLSTVKYTLGLKHSVSKQRGEEYRSHGQHGWLWLSSTRPFHPSDARTCGLRSGPHRLAVKIVDSSDSSSSRIVLMEPKAYQYYLQRNTLSFKHEGLDIEKLQEIFKNARVERQTEEICDVIDVEASLSSPTRSLYYRVGKKAKVIDEFLTRRLQLKALEEKRRQEKGRESSQENGLHSGTVTKEDEETETETTHKNAKETSQTSPSSSTTTMTTTTTNEKEREIGKQETKASYDNFSTFISTSKKRLWESLSTLKDVDSTIFYTCYSSLCSSSLSSFSCYSPSCQSLYSLKTILTTYEEIIQEAQNSFSLKSLSKVSFSVLTSKASVSDALTLLIKELMIKKEESDKLCAAGMSIVVENSSCKNSQVYSSSDTRSKLYLKRILTVGDSKKNAKVVKYPLPPHFYAQSRRQRNILLLAKHDVKRLARKWGSIQCEGFNYNAKVNSVMWPYPCPRPTFKTTWLFRTTCMTSFHAVALQLRILWASLRWDDMFTKPLSSDGKHQVTTDTSIKTTELLRHRNVGRYLERTEFLQRKVTIPLDVPKTLVEVTPIRSGLRKRKRAESPRVCEPQVCEEWIPEDKLELWELRAYREHLERQKTQSITRSRTGTLIREPSKFDPGDKKLNVTSSGSVSGSPVSSSIVPIRSSCLPSTPTIIRRVTNPDGSISLVKESPKPLNISSPSISFTRNPSLNSSTKKVFISKDGKIIGAQLAGTPNVATQQQKVQIVRSNDGKIQVRGLLPGQQLVQMPDGKLQIFSQSSSTTPVTTNTSNTTSFISTSPTLSSSASSSSSSFSVLSNKVSLSSPKSTVNQILATPLPPGSQIPPGMSVFMSGGKTYCIPKAATLAAQVTPKPSPTSKSQMVSVTTLGSNSVTFKGNQIIVSGTDQSQAQLIAQKLSSGSARLGTINGKQVLITTKPMEGGSGVQLPSEPNPSPKPVSSNAVTAQLVQTPQGPRIILQGIQGANLPTEQLMVIQTQVKNQLLKAQQEAKEKNQVPPTKISIVLPPSLKAQLSKEPENKFEVTPDYIQKTISDALKTQDLSPEIEQKLLHLQQSHALSPLTPKDTLSKTPLKKAGVTIDPATGEPMDDEWQPPSWSSKRGVVKMNTTTTPTAPTTTTIVPTLISGSKNETGDELAQPSSPKNFSVEDKRKNNNALSTTSLPTTTSLSSSSVATTTTTASLSSSASSSSSSLCKQLSSMLLRHKEQLKRDIAKKRAFQEKELQVGIANEIESITRNTAESSTKRSRDSDSESPKKKRKTTGVSALAAGIIKRDKVYCVCKTKYDPSKFYVGCDTCNNWFHGDCVGITEEMSKNMTEYFCEDCKNAKENQEIYCLCQQPYDELQFYIGCERCADWFHGRCVGILQVEADNIDEYICPRCDSNTSYNYANLKPLNTIDFDSLRKLVKQLVANRNSWPFKEPVDPNDVPNYYTVVKEPMDLQTIELRVNQSQYERLCDFVGDVMRIFENCRYFNTPNSQIMKCAESLESYFAQKLSLVREKVSSS